MSTAWLEKLQRGEILLLDGGMGTELQRRGVAMDEIAWSGAAVFTDPDLVRDTHEAYIHAGAEVITTNTFGSTRQMLEPAGYGDQVESVHRDAVRLAMEARDNAGNPDVAIAGSISTEPPGFDRGAFLSPADELAAYEEAATLLSDAGADLIALEMINETEHAGRAMEAALKTGLPVWLGLGAKQREDGVIVSFDHPDIEFGDLIDALVPLGPTVVNIMHSEIRAVPGAIELVRARWDGPIGIYPESGHFTQPHWNFVNVIAPSDLAREAEGWVAAGATMLGGCCGTGPEHIAGLKVALPALEAARGEQL